MSETVNYVADKVMACGSFGVVFRAFDAETGKVLAIKRVLQDMKYRNREFEIMNKLSHPCIVSLHSAFFTTDSKSETYLNLVMEYVPQTVHAILKEQWKTGKLFPLITTKIYFFQILRSIAYLHSLGITHRDVKPQNILLHPGSNKVKLCDFGSAKNLVSNQPNVSYICTRYYRAPELLFESTSYTTAVDLWSVGCVLGELLKGSPLFTADSSLEQIVEIIRVLGVPSKAAVLEMNPEHAGLNFPEVIPISLQSVLPKTVPPEAIDLLCRFLCYSPSQRIDAFSALAHPFFDELRSQREFEEPLPSSLFKFTFQELRKMQSLGLTKKIVPTHLLPTLFLETNAGLEIHPDIPFESASPAKLKHIGHGNIFQSQKSEGNLQKPARSVEPGSVGVVNVGGVKPCGVSTINTGGRENGHSESSVSSRGEWSRIEPTNSLRTPSNSYNNISTSNEYFPNNSRHTSGLSISSQTHLSRESSQHDRDSSYNSRSDERVLPMSRHFQQVMKTAVPRDARGGRDRDRSRELGAEFKEILKSSNPGQGPATLERLRSTEKTATDTKIKEASMSPWAAARSFLHRLGGSQAGKKC